MAEPGPPRDAAGDGLPMPRRALAIAAILAAVVLAVLDGAIANVALPSMASALNVSSAAAVAIVIAYQTALVVALLPAAALGESLGFRRVFTGGVLVFTVGSALCALSPSLPVLVAARFVQGLGAAAIMALLAALLRFTYPQRLLGAAIGLNALVVALTSAIGPSLGAAILSFARWPWLFAVNIPVGLIVLAASRALPDAPAHGRPLDRVSLALNAGVFAPMVVGVDILTTSRTIGLALLATAALCLVALVRREVPRAAPLIPLDLLRGRSFRLSVIASVCCFSAQMIVLVALPFYLQHGLGRDAVATGLFMTPWPLTVALAAPIVGRLADRVSTAALCACGSLTLTVGLGLAASWPLEHDLRPLVVFTIVSGAGFGLFQTPNTRNLLLSSPKNRSGAVGGMQAMAREFGLTSGAVIVALLFSTVGPNAPRIALGVGAALAALAGLASGLRIERRDAGQRPVRGAPARTPLGKVK